MRKDGTMSNVIVQKAYEIILDRLDEGYLSDHIVCFADSRNKAKARLLSMVKYDDWKLRFIGDELTYLNIPIRRLKSADVVIFEGQEMGRWEIQPLIVKRERLAKLDAILNDPTIKYCYIRKGDYYRPNAKGYTSNLFEAGVYTKEDAVSKAKSCQELTLVIIDIDVHNKMLTDKINELQVKLL